MGPFEGSDPFHSSPPTSGGGRAGADGGAAPDQDRVVIRTRLSEVGSTAAIELIGVGVLGALFLGSSRAGLVVLTTAVVCWLAAAGLVAWRLTRFSVVVTGDEIAIRNFWWERRVPWDQVASVEPGTYRTGDALQEGLVLMLRDGGRAKMSAFPRSRSEGARACAARDRLRRACADAHVPFPGGPARFEAPLRGRTGPVPSNDPAPAGPGEVGVPTPPGPSARPPTGVPAMAGADGAAGSAPLPFRWRDRAATIRNGAFGAVLVVGGIALVPILDRLGEDDSGESLGAMGVWIAIIGVTVLVQAFCGGVTVGRDRVRAWGPGTSRPVEACERFELVDRPHWVVIELVLTSGRMVVARHRRGRSTDLLVAVGALNVALDGARSARAHHDHLPPPPTAQRCRRLARRRAPEQV